MAPDNEDQLPKAQKSQKPPKVDEPLAELTAFEQRIQSAKDKCRPSHVVVVCGQKNPNHSQSNVAVTAQTIPEQRLRVGLKFLSYVDTSKQSNQSQNGTCRCSRKGVVRATIFRKVLF
jgi:hypothetical protein